MHNSKTKKDIADSKNSSDKSAQHVCSVTEDTVSEWLRRWTRNPLGSARRGSNPLGVAFNSFPMRLLGGVESPTYILHNNQRFCGLMDKASPS